MTTKASRQHHTPSPKQQAYRFFYANAGSSHDPKTETAKQGRARGARRLAQAERDARAAGFYFTWMWDGDGCIGCDCKSEDCACFTGVEHETLGCIMHHSGGQQIQSLWGICKPSQDYRRVVEAELALEELGKGGE